MIVRLDDAEVTLVLDALATQPLAKTYNLFTKLAQQFQSESQQNKQGQLAFGEPIKAGGTD